MENTLSAIDFRLFIGCFCYIKDSPGFSVIEGIDINSNMVIINKTNHDPSLVKPILRRFDSLSRQEIEELNKLWPTENIKRTLFGSIQLDAKIINFLTLLHIDVYGWIDQELAIDAAYNTIGSNHS